MDYLIISQVSGIFRNHPKNTRVEKSVPKIVRIQGEKCENPTNHLATDAVWDFQICGSMTKKYY